MPFKLSTQQVPGHLGITYRLVLYIVMVASVPIVLVALFAFRSGSQGIQRHTSLHLISVVVVKAQEVESWLRPLEASVQVLVNSTQVKDVLRTLLEGTNDQETEAARQQVLGYLQEVVRRSTGLQQMAVLSAQERRVLVATAPFLDDTLASVPLAQAPGNPMVVHLQPYSPDTEVTLLSIAAPVVVDGRILAHLVLLATPVPLYETLAPDAGLGPNGNVYVVNQHGYVLTPPQKFPSGVDTIRAMGVVLESGNRFGSGLRYRDFFGTEVVGAYQPIEFLGWGVVAELPAAEAFSDIERMRWAIVGASAIFFVLIGGTAVLISHHITRPLRILTRGAREIGSGNLAHRIRLNSRDEIGMLAQSFNQMAADLQTAQSMMVEAERAAALQAFTESKVQQLKQLSQLGLRIALESSQEGLVRATPELAREVTRADMAALVVLSEDGSQLLYMHHTESQDSSLVHALVEDPAFLQCIRLGVRLSYPDDMPQVHPACLERFQSFRAVLISPIHSEARDVAGAVIIANARQDKVFSQEDQELIQIVAGYISAAIQKLRKEERLRESEQKALEAVKELRRAQEQLVQSQKMESIGRLAGGVAHDFNNLLTPILGYAQLGIMALPQGEGRLRTSLVEIQKAAERASNLTRQLLAFSRRQIIEPKVVSLNELILNMDKMLRRLIGEDIELTTLPCKDLGLVKVDPGQIEQVVMNLVVNARDAMPNGGKLTIETGNEFLGPEYAERTPDVTPGEYVMLAVSDTGIGMTEYVKAHVFEPFFTTKEAGKGTGLGLATCYGIIKQNGGHIAVYSEVGKGTTMKVYLPRVYQQAERFAQPEDSSQMPRGKETVLLVEDDTSVRALAARVLREQGYTVLEASNGREAIQIAQEHASQEIHLLLADVVMPQMGGRELAVQLKATRPGIRVLFTSGYTDDAIVRHGVLDPEVAFTHKPFSPTSLARKVREVLDSPVPSAAGASSPRPTS